MLGIAALGELALAQFITPQVTTPAPTQKVVGWFQEWDKPRRRITIEQLQAILAEQGSPWAAELADTVTKLKPKSKKHAALVQEVHDAIAQHAAAPLDWAPIIEGLRAAQQATRTTLAIKHLDYVLSLFQGEEDEEEWLLLI